MFVWNQIKVVHSVVHYPFTHYFVMPLLKLNSHILAKPLQIGLNSLVTYSLNGKHISNITLILCRAAAYKSYSWLSPEKAINYKQCIRRAPIKRLRIATTLCNGKHQNYGREIQYWPICETIAFRTYLVTLHVIKLSSNKQNKRVINLCFNE